MAVSYYAYATDAGIVFQLMGFTKRDYDLKFYFWIKKSSSPTWSAAEEDYMTAGNTTIAHAFTGLEPGTSYDVRARYINQSTSEGYNRTVTTTGTSYNEMTGEASIYYTGGTSLGIRLSGVNTNAGYARTVNIYYKPAGGSYVLSKTETISGSSSSSNFYYSIYGLNEKTSYTVKIEVLNPYGNTLKSWELPAQTGFDTSGTLSVSDVTEKSCTLTVSNIAYSTQYPRTLQWYGREGVGGSWELLTTTIAGGGESYTYTINSLIPKTYYDFKVEVFAGGENLNTLEASCTTDAASGTFTVSDATEYSAKALLSGLATGVSYVRVIKWFYKASTDSDYTEYTKQTRLLQDASSAVMVIDALASSTAYSIKAEVYNTSDKLLGSWTGTISTTDTAATIEVGTKTSASIRITIKDLEPAAYTRTFEWYYKRQTDAEYTLFDATDKLETDPDDSVSKVYKPLAAKTYYDFKVLIKKGDTVMKQLTVSDRTLINNDIVPDAEIERIEASVGSKTVNVFWDAPEHESGFLYKLQYSESEDGTYTDLTEALDAPPEICTEVTLPALDKRYYIRVHSYYTVDGEVASKFSDPASVYLYSAFDWETAKVQGQAFKVTASEWNTLIKTVKTRLANDEKNLDDYPMDLAVKARGVSAAQFNQVADAIDAFNDTGLADQAYGNAISAEKLNVLKTKVNLG